LAVAALSVLAWALPALPAFHAPAMPDRAGIALARILAFGLALASAGVFGEFLIALAGEDPFATLRGLPLAVMRLWRERVLWAAAFAALLVIAHALAARPLEGAPRAFFLEWAGAAALAIGILAVNYSLTLFPRADAAQRVFLLTLGLSMAASIMIPLMGWIVLASGIVHSALRLPRWERLEDAV
jgi:hypothetical protein